MFAFISCCSDLLAKSARTTINQQQKTSDSKAEKQKQAEIKRLKSDLAKLEENLRWKRKKLEKLLYDPADKTLPHLQSAIASLKKRDFRASDDFFSAATKLSYSSNENYRKLLKLSIIYIKARITATMYAINFLYEIQAYERPESTPEQEENKKTVRDRSDHLNNEALHLTSLLNTIMVQYLNNYDQVGPTKLFLNLPTSSTCLSNKNLPITLLDFNPAYMEEKIDELRCSSTLTSIRMDLKENELQMIFKLGDFYSSRYKATSSVKIYRTIARGCFQKVIEAVRLLKFSDLRVLSEERLAWLK